MPFAAWYANQNCRIDFGEVQLMKLHSVALMICCIWVRRAWFEKCQEFKTSGGTPKIVHAEKREFVRQSTDLENTRRLAMSCSHASWEGRVAASKESGHAVLVRARLYVQAKKAKRVSRQDLPKPDRACFQFAPPIKYGIHALTARIDPHAKKGA